MIDSLDEQRKIALLNAALTEFTTNGYDKASTNIIAKEAGLSKPLMFHYIGNKQQLFLITYDYFDTLLEETYFSKIDSSIPDFFGQLRHMLLLQIDLIRSYPAILAFEKLSEETKSATINAELAKRKHKKVSSCLDAFFLATDLRFIRTGLDQKKCQQILLWSLDGLTKQLLAEISQQKQPLTETEPLIERLDEYLSELKKLFC